MSVPADAATDSDVPIAGPEVELPRPAPAWEHTFDRLAYGTRWRAPQPPEMAAFREWTDRYLRAATETERAALEPEGVNLARARRPVMRSMIERDPERALEITVPMAVRTALPSRIEAEFEARVAGTGMFAVVPRERAFSDGNHADHDDESGFFEGDDRFIYLSGGSYVAHTYGRRRAQSSEEDASLHGLALDGQMAVHASPLRVLDPGETPAVVPESVDPVTGEPIIAAIGNEAAPALVAFHGRVWALAEPSSLGRLERSLRAMETLPGPVQPPFEPGVLIEPPMAEAAPTAWTTGTKKLLVLRVDFPDVIGEPRDSYSNSTITQSFAQNLLNNQVKPYYAEASYDQTTLNVTVSNKVYRLPKSAVTYGVDYDLLGLYNDATAAARGDHNADNFDLVQIVFSYIGPQRFPSSQFGFAGVAFRGGKQSFINGYYLFDVVAHEIGHNYGLPHANLWQSYSTSMDDWGSSQEYGDVYDIMGGYNGSTDRRYHFNPWFKNELGWIPDSAVTLAASDGTYRIYRFDAQNAPRTHPLALNVFRDGCRSYWIGNRRNVPGAMNQSAYVQWGFYGIQQSQLLDLNTPGGNLEDAGLAVGGTLDDSVNGVSLRTVATGGTSPSEYLDIAVTIAPPARNIIAHWGEDEAVQVPPGLRDVVEMAAGDEHMFVRKRSGEILTYGDGDPEGSNRFGELIIPYHPYDQLESIAAGGDSCGMILKDGTIRIWGIADFGQNNVPAGLGNVKQLGIGGDHVLALRHDGTVVGWGSNEKGQITLPAGLGPVRAISAGRDMSLLLMEDGTVRHLGINAAQLPGNLTNVIAVAAGWGHGLALRNDGTVVAWGDNSDGQVTVPSGLNNVKQIGAGHRHSVALKHDGTIVAWGNNDFRQVTLPRGLPKVEAIAVAENHVAALIPGTNKPFFTSAPQAQTVALGGYVYFTAYAEGLSTTTYQWQRQAAGSSTWVDLVDGAGFSGTRDPSLIVSGVTPVLDGNRFRCVATDQENRTGISGAALLTVTVPPLTVYSQPDSLTVNSGRGADLSFRVEGAFVTYRWQRQAAGTGAWQDLVNGAEYTGVAELHLNVVRTSFAMNGDRFRCIASNGYAADVTSTVATLTVIAQDLMFTLQPSDLNLPWGQTGDLRIAVAGEAPFRFRWQRRAAGTNEWSDLTDDASYAGTTTEQLTLRDAVLAWNGDEFRCIVGDTLVSALTSATSRVRVVFAAPVADTWPMAETATAGGGVTFRVQTPADPSPAYQWRRNGEALAGETGAALTLTDLDDDASAVYDVVFTRGDGATFTSLPTLLRVSPAAYGHRFAARVGFDPVFASSGNQPAEVHTVLPLGDGWLVGGTFTSVDGQPRGSIARIRRDGSLDPAMFANGAGFNGFVYALARAPDGRVYVGGGFTMFNGQPRARVARLLADGTLDASFDLPAQATAGSNFRVYSVLPDAAGRVYVGGSFSSRVGPDSQGLLIADATGAVLSDSTFAAGDQADVWDLAMDPLTGRVLVAGTLRYYVDAQTHCGVRVLADGTIDSSFLVTGYLGWSAEAAYLPDGRIMMCGNYLPLAVNTALKKVIRLGPDGARDYSFESPAGLDGNAQAMAVQNDGRTVVGGPFANIYQTPQVPLLRLDNDGAFDPSFVVEGMVPATNGETIWDLHYNADGTLLVAGSWMPFGAVSGGGLVLLECRDPAPEIAASPQPQVVAAGSAVTMRVETSGEYPPVFQWRRDGVDLRGATSAEYRLPSVQAFDAGDYTVVVRNGAGAVETAAAALTVNEPAPSAARLTNLSTRALDLTGDKVLIPGFVIQGPGSKRLLIRAVGPTLSAPPYYLSGTLPNPRLALKRFNGAGYDDLLANDDWNTNPNAAEIIAASNEFGAFALADGSADAALLVELDPGQYSVVADDPAGATGIAIVELYDADETGTTSRLINISNRGFVGLGDALMIPGIVISSEGPKTLLIRAVGPTLGAPPYNVGGVLADPTLEIHRLDLNTGIPELILANDNWSAVAGADRTRDVAAQVSAFALPEGSKDAAFVVTLNPGVYTVHARGKDDTEGVALVEVYAVP